MSFLFKVSVLLLVSQLCAAFSMPSERANQGSISAISRLPLVVQSPHVLNMRAPKYTSVSTSPDGDAITESSPSETMLKSLSRRSILGITIGLITGVVGVRGEASLADDDSTPATDDDDEKAKEAAAADAAKERMAQRIAESKTKYRKPVDLVKQRKETTDYSCVASTGSPCPEGLVPREIQKELAGVLDGMVKN
jgi:hypothetical protein